MKPFIRTPAGYFDDLQSLKQEIVESGILDVEYSDIEMVAKDANDDQLCFETLRTVLLRWAYNYSHAHNVSPSHQKVCEGIIEMIDDPSLNFHELSHVIGGSVINTFFCKIIGEMAEEHKRNEEAEDEQ